MAVVNVGEDDLDRIDEIVAPVAEPSWAGRAEVLGICVQLEAEAAELVGEERAEMLEALGLGEGALERFVHTAYDLLGLRTFLTTGDKESRAWTFRAGSKAPQAAGRHPHRLRAGLHPGRGHPLGRAARDRVVGQGQGGRQDPRRGQGVRRRRRRRHGVPLQRLRPGHAGPVLVIDDLEVATTRRARGRGLLGRDGIDGALWLPGVRSVHTVGMRFALDVAWLDRRRPGPAGPDPPAAGRVSAWVPRAAGVLEAEAGAFARWGLAVGSVVDLCAEDGHIRPQTHKPRG